MMLKQRQTLARMRILELQTAIQESIDKICEREKYEVTYAEINSALLKVISSNNWHELRTLWEVGDDEMTDEQSRRS